MRRRDQWAVTWSRLCPPAFRMTLIPASPAAAPQFTPDRATHRIRDHFLTPPDTMPHALAQLRRLRRGFRRYARQCVSAALLVPLVVVATGVPIPSAPPATTAERYPCEACHCGCASADQCWRHCCCHSLAERLAWALRNNVRPPDFALADARQASLDVSDWIPGDECRQTSPVRTCCVDRSEPAVESSCCSHHRPTPAATGDRAPCCSRSSVATKTAPSTDYVVAWRAMACNGQSLDSVATVPMLVSARRELAGELPFSYWLQAPASHVAAGVSPLPSVPPPEWV